jgi:hypothetical protein
MQASIVSEINITDLQHLASQVAPEFEFMSQGWYPSWGSKYLPSEHSNSHIKYISITDINKKLQGIYPCVVIPKFGFKILSAAGFYYPFRTILHSSELTTDCANAIVETINYQIKENIIRIGPANIDEPINQIIKRKFKDLGWMCNEINHGAQKIITLPSHVDEFKQSLGKSLRKNLKRRLKQLQGLGEVTIEKFNSCSSEEWTMLVDDCSDIESQSWLFSDAKGKMGIKGKESFWKEYLKGKDAQRRVNIWLVKLNGHPISFTLAIDSGLCRYSISGQYNAQFKKYGVGLLADYEMLQDSIYMGIKIVNLGDGDAEYKARWGAKHGSQLADYIYFRPNIFGRLLYSVLKVSEIVRFNH